MNTEQLFLGIDGGQSGTRCLIVDQTGKVFAQATSDKIDFVLASGGKAKLKATLSSLLSKACSNRPPKFRSACLGLSGVTQDGELEQVVQDVCGEIFETDQLVIDNDSLIAWAGAFACQPGIVIIAGSGSVAFGVNHKRQTARAGGWGFLFGDKGGGFGIARDGLKMILDGIDSNNPISSMIQIYNDHFHGVRPDQLVRDFYAGKITRAELATVTPKIATLARDGDDDAQRLFDQSAQYLASKIKGVSGKLEWPTNQIMWSPIGGVFKSEEVILDPLTRHLQGDGLNFKYLSPEFPPVVGAVLFAIEQAYGYIPAGIIDQLKIHFTRK